MKKMILGIVWQLMGFLGSIIILCSAAPYQWNYNGITGILGSLLGLDLIIPLIICIIFLFAVQWSVSRQQVKSKIQLIESPNWEEGIPTALSEIMDKLCDALDE